MRKIHGVRLAFALAFVVSVSAQGQQPREQHTTSIVSSPADDAPHWKNALPMWRRFIIRLLEDLGAPRP